MASGYLQSEFVPTHGVNEGAYGSQLAAMAPRPFTTQSGAASGATANPALKGQQKAVAPQLPPSSIVPDLSGQFAQPQSYANNWQLQGGFDMSGPGAAEDAYAKNSGQLSTPGSTEQYAGQYNPMNMGGATGAYTQKYNPMAMGGATDKYASNPGSWGDAYGATASGQYWNSLQGQSNAPKDMGAYYDRASDRSAATVNRQAGARGMFNSSAAMDQLGKTEADIRSQQARDEAQYGLQSAALQNDIMSGASRSADAAAQGRYGMGLQAAQASDQLGLGRYSAGLQGAMASDSNDLSRFGAGLNAATAADNAKQGRLGLLGQGASAADVSRQGRVGSVYDNLATLSGGLAGTLGGAYSDMFGTDQGLFDMGQQMSLGSGLANLAGAQNNSALNMAAGQGMANTFSGAGQDVQNVLALTSKAKAK